MQLERHDEDRIHSTFRLNFSMYLARIGGQRDREESSYDTPHDL